LVTGATADSDWTANGISVAVGMVTVAPDDSCIDCIGYFSGISKSVTASLDDFDGL